MRHPEADALQLVHVGRHRLDRAELPQTDDDRHRAGEAHSASARDPARVPVIEDGGRAGRGRKRDRGCLPPTERQGSVDVGGDDGQRPRIEGLADGQGSRSGLSGRLLDDRLGGRDRSESGSDELQQTEAGKRDRARPNRAPEQPLSPAERAKVGVELAPIERDDRDPPARQVVDEALRGQGGKPGASTQGHRSLLEQRRRDGQPNVRLVLRETLQGEEHRLRVVTVGDEHRLLARGAQGSCRIVLEVPHTHALHVPTVRGNIRARQPAGEPRAAPHRRSRRRGPRRPIPPGARFRHHRVVTERTLTRAHLLRALLARQLLLERSSASIPDALDQVAGLQTQYAPSGYVGLWSRLAGFERGFLTRALEDRSVVQATLMRATIHLVSAREHWRYASGVRQPRREWWLRAQRGRLTEQDAELAAARMRAALADGPRSVKELGGEAAGFLGGQGLWVDLVRVPPSGTWERRRADRLALAETWVGPCDATEAEGAEHLVRAYLRGFGPARWTDIAAWAGIPAPAALQAGEGLDLVRYRDEGGRELVDLRDAPLPDPDTPAPVRFLPHWDANLLVHARRTGILPEPFRPRVFSTRTPFSVGTYLVEGVVAGAWSVREGTVVLDPFETVSASVRREVEREREALEAFHA